jgi:hypothetical protein
MANWIIAVSVLGGVLFYPQYIHYVGGLGMAKWIVAGSVLVAVALLAVALWAPTDRRPQPAKTAPTRCSIQGGEA